jgi:hypothetical protein
MATIWVIQSSGPNPQILGVFDTLSAANEFCESIRISDAPLDPALSRFCRPVAMELNAARLDSRHCWLFISERGSPRIRQGMMRDPGTAGLQISQVEHIGSTMHVNVRAECYESARAVAVKVFEEEFNR